jgi:hypothetical protein
MLRAIPGYFRGEVKEPMHGELSRKDFDVYSPGVFLNKQQRRNRNKRLMTSAYIGLLCLAVFFSLLEPCHANPIVPSDWIEPQFLEDRDFVFAFALIVALLAGALVEYAVLYLVLRRSLPARWPLFEAVILINVVTMPPAQALWWWLVQLAEKVALPHPKEASMLAVEILVVAAEFWMLKKRLATMYKKRFLIETVSDQRTFLAIGTANLASFVLMLPGLGLITAIMDATGPFISHLLDRL